MTDDLETLFKKAAEIAGGLPESMQAAGFHRALDILLGGTASDSAAQETAEARKSSVRGPKSAKKAKKATTRKTTKKAAPKLVKDLNLRPADKESFAEFVSKKEPSSDHERKLVSVYYLDRTLELDAVTVDHVYTCFRSAGWRVPTDLATSLMLTASRKGWLDTSDTAAISVTIGGENFLEYELPKSSKASK